MIKNYISVRTHIFVVTVYPFALHITNFHILKLPLSSPLYIKFATLNQIHGKRLAFNEQSHTNLNVAAAGRTTQYIFLQFKRICYCGIYYYIQFCQDL